LAPTRSRCFFLEDAERPRAKGDEVALRIVDLRLGGRRPAGAVEDLALAGYAPAADRAQEVDVHLDGRRPDANQRQHRETHRVVNEGGVYAAMQRTGAVEVVVLDVDVYDRSSRLYLLDLRPDVPRERYPLVESLQTRSSSLRAPLTSKVPSENANVLSLSIL
jgi:hypothetical protein